MGIVMGIVKNNFLKDTRVEPYSSKDFRWL